jgi:uroporphyrinogen III methyltransferase/synthase
VAEPSPVALPLLGRAVVVTRPAEQARALVEPLEELGAEVLVAPTIRIVPLALDDGLRAAARHLGGYDLLIFTSANAVRHFAARVDECLREEAGAAEGEDDGELLSDAFGGVTVAAIGPRTADELVQRGLPCDIVPDEFVAEGLVEALAAAGLDLDGARVLIPRAREARDLLPQSLASLGAEVDVVPVYETVPAEELAIDSGHLAAADFITFASASSVNQMIALLGAGAAKLLAGPRLVSIGPQTSAALAAHGLEAAAEADPHTGAGLVQAIVRLVAGAR